MFSAEKSTVTVFAIIMKNAVKCVMGWAIGGKMAFNSVKQKTRLQASSFFSLTVD